jgi:acetyl esterase
MAAATVHLHPLQEHCMPLHPDAKAFLDARTAAGSRPVTELSVQAARDQSVEMLKLLGPPEEVARVSDLEIMEPDHAIPVRVYQPLGTAPFPMVVFFHGGGWVLGSLSTADFFCRQLANASGCLVVSVNYRHAPEDQYPAAPEDCYAATLWASERAEDIGGDASHLAVAGSSAGGNLAAVVTLMARDRRKPAIAFQLLIVPVIDYNFETMSYRENAEGYGLTTDGMRWFWKHYLRDPGQGDEPFASPIRATDLAGLPPAFVVTAEYDPLRDEGEAYAVRLKQSGVQVTNKRYEGMIHGYQGSEVMKDMAARLRLALGSVPR